jgi:hypothetical protein
VVGEGPFSGRELGQSGPRSISATDIVGLPCQHDIVEMVDGPLPQRRKRLQ